VLKIKAKVDLKSVRIESLTHNVRIENNTNSQIITVIKKESNGIHLDTIKD